MRLRIPFSVYNCHKYPPNSFNNPILINKGVNGSKLFGYSHSQIQTLIVKHKFRPRLKSFGYKIYETRPDLTGSRIGFGYSYSYDIFLFFLQIYLSKQKDISDKLIKKFRKIMLLVFLFSSTICL